MLRNCQDVLLETTWTSEHDMKKQLCFIRGREHQIMLSANSPNIPGRVPKSLHKMTQMGQTNPLGSTC